MKREHPGNAAHELRNFQVQELEDEQLAGVVGADNNCVCGCEGSNCVCGGCGNGVCPIKT